MHYSYYISEEKCPKGGYLYDEKTNIFYKRYMLFIDRVPWSDAKAKCENEGAQLLIIRNREMLDFAIRGE